MAFFARTEARLSLYENAERFRAPTSLVWSLGPTTRVHGIDACFEGQHQTVAR